MKKLLSIILLFLAIFTLTACDSFNNNNDKVDCIENPTHEECDTDPVDPINCETGYEEINGECELIVIEDYLEIYYLNDLHGAILPDEDQLGLTYIGNLINTKKTENPDNVLFLAGGDMLQGSALSNYYNGLSTINILNEMNLDAFTVGNHEFDWGLDTITGYADGNIENGEADFPFLGANIFYEGTENIPEEFDPYTIIQKGDHKVGIIGTMGYGLEYAIAEARINGYNFGEPQILIEYYSHYLRTEEDCDVVIVMAHDTGSINDYVTGLTGDYKVDAVFNAHSHNSYATLVNGVPTIQSGSNGENVGYLKMTFQDDGTIKYNYENYNKYSSSLLHEEDLAVKTLIEQYQSETDELFNTPIITNYEYLNKFELSEWLSTVIAKATGADIAFQNNGGTRTDVQQNEVYNLALLYQIWPFDNVIKTTELTGAQIKIIISQGDSYYTEVTNFDDDTTYLVATNDYSFDKDGSLFQNGSNEINTGILMRELAEDELILQSAIYDNFKISNSILTNNDDGTEEPITCNPGYELVDGTCQEVVVVDNFLEIYYINDLHGAILPSDYSIGLSYMGNLVNTRKEENPENVLFLAGGDILQGSALSNYYNGLSTINILGEMNLDAFTIGNHEFDWGLDTITSYADGNLENGEATFPFLGANIFYTGTENIPNEIDPYTIIEKAGHKIGIIGTMGYGLEGSIAAGRVGPYDFGDPESIIEYYAHYLRTEEDCDVIIVVAHDTGGINNYITSLTGDYKIDAVFNAHSHSTYATFQNGIPTVQSGGNGSRIGYVKMTFDDNGSITYTIDNLGKFDNDLLSNEDPEVKTLITQYELETDELFNTPIITNDSYLGKSDLSYWLTQVISKATNADISFQNSGGTRSDVSSGEVFDLTVLYRIWPFDNIIKTTNLYGYQIKDIMDDYGMIYSTDISYFDDNTLYLVATNDYIYDYVGSKFQDGINPDNTGLLLRDIVEDELILQSQVYSIFQISNPILLTSTVYTEETINP